MDREERQLNGSTSPDHLDGTPHQQIGATTTQEECEDQSAVEKDSQSNGSDEQLQKSAVVDSQSNGTEEQLQESALEKDSQSKGTEEQLQQSAVEKDSQSNGTEEQLQGSALEKDSQSKGSEDQLQQSAVEKDSQSNGSEKQLQESAVEKDSQSNGSEDQLEESAVEKDSQSNGSEDQLQESTVEKDSQSKGSEDKLQESAVEKDSQSNGSEDQLQESTVEDSHSKGSEDKLQESAVEKDSPSNGSEDQLRESAVEKDSQSNGSEDQLEESAKDQNSQPDDKDNPLKLVIYDPAANSAGGAKAVPDPKEYQKPHVPRIAYSDRASRLLPSVGTFTVQCASCLKWRLTSKEKYEEIREHILERPFFCEAVREWRAGVSCDSPTDIAQDGSRLWAIDKPNIPRSPPGWQRLLRIRGEGGTKFADVYYVAPDGKRLRSMVEIERYLQEHPDYLKWGINMSQFSFRTPSPLNESYVRKRRRSNEPIDVEPISVAPPAGPDAGADMQLTVVPGLTPYFEASSSGPGVDRPQKRMRGGPAEQMFSSAPAPL